MAARVFRPGNKFKFGWQPESHRVYYGSAVDGDERAIDEASPGVGLQHVCNMSCYSWVIFEAGPPRSDVTPGASFLPRCC